MAREELFEDPDFRATNASLYYSQESSRSFEWLRPMVGSRTIHVYVEKFEYTTLFSFSGNHRRSGFHRRGSFEIRYYAG